jgi:hypothetical protein
MARHPSFASMAAEGRMLMPTLMLALMIAFVVCVLLLAAFGLFTISPFAGHIDRFNEPGQRQDGVRPN